jgi:hypothetical protein
MLPRYCYDGWRQNALEYALIAQVTAPRDRVDQALPAHGGGGSGIVVALPRRQIAAFAGARIVVVVFVDGRQWQ